MFSFKRVYTIFRARNKEFTRDYGAIGWTIIFPLFLVFAFSRVFNLDDSFRNKVGVVGDLPIDEKFFEFISQPNWEEATRKLQRHQLDLILDTENKVYAINNAGMKSQLAERILLSNEKFSIERTTWSRETFVVEEIPYIQWLMPGILTMNVMWMALWGVGWVIVRQRKMGILKRFKVSPLTPLEYLLAQMGSRMIMLLFTGAVILGGCFLFYPFEFKGSLFDFLLVFSLGCLALNSIGLVIASRMQSEELASGLLNFISFPMMMLSEIWFSLEGSPQWVKSLAHLSPLWHMTEASRLIINFGQNLQDIFPHLLYLLIFSAVFTSIGAIFFKWTGEGR